MQLTLYTGAGLRVLLFLASDAQESRVTVGQLADVFDLSKNHLVKVVNKLAKQGYIIAMRGKGGGIVLGRTPSEINLAEVIRFLEVTTDIVDCQKNACCLVGSCKLKGLLNQATVAFFASLEQYSLADIIMQPEAFQSIVMSNNE